MQSATATAKLEGVVKWFNSAKGFGFIVGDDGQDYFVHYSEIKVRGFKNLDAGLRVRFESETREKGLMAARVQVLDEGYRSEPRTFDKAK